MICRGSDLRPGMCYVDGSRGIWFIIGVYAHDDKNYRNVTFFRKIDSYAYFATHVFSMYDSIFPTTFTRIG